MSLFSEFIERNIGKIDDGGFSDYFDEKVYKPYWQDPLEGGRWMNTTPGKMLMIPEMYEDFKTNYEGGAFYRDRIGGGEFDKAWGGGNWMKRFGIGGGDDDIDTSSSSGSGSGSTDTADSSMEQNQNSPEEERARLDAIRRMLAGRYGRAETNLTGGAGYGSGSGRSIGGYSG